MNICKKLGSVLMTKTQSIYIRCSKEEKATIMINASMKKMNISNYLRNKGLEFVIPEKDNAQMELVDFVEA